MYTEGNFLEVFSFPLISGSPSIKTPGTLALTESVAKKLLGSTDVVGKTITVSNQFGNTIYTINAVINDIPQSSDIKGNVFLSIHTLESAANRDGNDWADPNTLESGFVNIYTLLQNNANVPAIEKQVTEFMHNTNPQLKNKSFVVQPFKYLHLAPDFNYPYQTYGSLTLVTMLFAVAIAHFIHCLDQLYQSVYCSGAEKSKRIRHQKSIRCHTRTACTEILIRNFYTNIAQYY